MTGVVYLIGAGPGDPGLITARGLECLTTADVVVHDRLIHPRLLQRVRGDAETIDVGADTPQAVAQEAICYLLVEKAREGKTVARLKSGDPLMFDRGDSEAIFLHKQGVKFEIVPGVPAGIAVPAYAGIPLTYPGSGGDTLTFVRYQEDGTAGRSTIDWASLSRLAGTLVFYGAPPDAAQIAKTLVAHGRSADEPAAIVFDGTLPTQRTELGTLGDIGLHPKANAERQPALLIVGRVAAAREHLRWFDSRPLFGKRILVTRPREQAAELVGLLEAKGAEAIEAPMIRIVPPDDLEPLDAACRQAGLFDVIVFSSANAVDQFMTRFFEASSDVRGLKGVRLCGVGPATAERLARYGLKLDLMPTEYRAEALLQAICAAIDVRGLRVLIPRADIGRDLVADELRQRGADVTEVVAYRTVAAEPDREGEPDVYRMLLEHRIDVVTFTSASAVRSFVRLLGEEPAADLLHATLVASIGPLTAEAATQCNIQTTIMPERYTIPALVDAIVAHFQKSKP